jgi:surfactin synthase thioesterase subunit
MLFARAWLARGLDVALLTLPHHGRRRPAGARFSGEPFATPHVGRMAEAVRQAVWEIRLLAAWLRRARSAPVGLLGLSLGGTLAALAAGLWDEFDFAVPMASPVCIGDLAWRFMTRSRSFRGAPREVSRRELRALFRAISPLAHPLRIPRERALVVGGRGDRIVPPEHPAALWRHWGEPPLHWFAGSHLAPIGRGGIVDAVERHLRGLGLL